MPLKVPPSWLLPGLAFVALVRAAVWAYESAIVLALRAWLRGWQPGG